MATPAPIPGARRPDPRRPCRVLGIDPGLNVTGYAVVEATAAPLGHGRAARVIEAGVIRGGRASRAATEADEALAVGTAALAERLRRIHEGVLEVLDAFEPEALALEQVHSHPKFPRTAILMSHARGVIVLAARLRDVPVQGYAASRIKKTLTGSGKAPKLQMQHAIRTELGLDRLPEPHDVADACAIALCHLQTARSYRPGR